jgi:predicted helicase
MNKLAKVYHFDLYGKRDEKYDFLNNNSIKDINWNDLDYKTPNYFFVLKNNNDESYDLWFSLNDIFSNVNNGIKTDRDSLFIGESRETIEKRFKVLLSNNIPNVFIEKYRVIDSGSFKITERIKAKSFSSEFIKPILYRPFDIRFIYYDPQIVSRPAQKVMKHMKNGNFALLCCRQQSSFDFQHILISKILTEVCTVSLQTKETTYAFPLYLYPDSSENTLGVKEERRPNLNMEIVNKIAEGLGLEFVAERESTPSSLRDATPQEGNLYFAPIDILDYIYAVLHSPTYREKYKEFLKIDFPRVPYPSDKEVFWQLVRLGGELRQIHLLESPIVEQYITGYPIDGDNVVDKVKYEIEDRNPLAPFEKGGIGKVYINKEQHFTNVPEVAWNFYIGGYQPAQKWLKDRKGRVLNFDDILHYQKIIVALNETDRIMKEINEIEI